MSFASFCVFYRWIVCIKSRQGFNPSPDIGLLWFYYVLSFRNIHVYKFHISAFQYKGIYNKITTKRILSFFNYCDVLTKTKKDLIYNKNIDDKRKVTSNNKLAFHYTLYLGYLHFVTKSNIGYFQENALNQCLGQFCKEYKKYNLR